MLSNEEYIQLFKECNDQFLHISIHTIIMEAQNIERYYRVHPTMRNTRRHIAWVSSSKRIGKPTDEGAQIHLLLI